MEGQGIDRRYLQPIPESVESIALCVGASLLLPGFIVIALEGIGTLLAAVESVRGYLVLLATPAAFILLTLWRLRRLRHWNAFWHVPKGLDRPAYLRAMLFGAAVFLSNVVMTALSTRLVGAVLGMEAADLMARTEQQRAIALLNPEASHLPVAYVVLVLVIVTPIAEELFFRGYLYGALRYHMNAGRAALLSALVFSLFHFYVVQFIPILVAGLLFAWLYERTASVTAPILAHAVVNALVVGVLVVQG